MIEIEKKFILTSEQRRALLKNATPIGSKTIVDTYYDNDTYDLTTKNLWFRSRDGSYELKAPLSFDNSSQVLTNQFHELTDQADIAAKLELSPTHNFDAALALKGITAFMTVTTERTSYRKDGFNIDIDTATYDGSKFEHAVSEIELMIESETDAERASDKIIAFAKQFDLITDQLILGKVAAYLRVEKPKHFQALTDAGIFN